MPYILLTRGRKIALVLISAILAQLPLLYLLMFERKALINSIKPVGYSLYMISSIKVISIILLSIILALLPYSIIYTFNRMYLDSIDKNLSPFFKALAESVRAGMPFHKAMESVARVTPGPLGAEIKKLLVKVELGASLNSALNSFAEKFGVPSIRRAVTVLITASESGGKVVEVLDTAAEMHGLLRAYEEERRTRIAPYSWIIYMSIGLFLIVSFILIYAFLEPLSVLISAGAFLGIPRIDISVFKAVLFITAALQAFFGGLLVGKIRTGTIYAGFFHVIVLLVAVIVSFNLMEIYGPVVTRAIFTIPAPTPPSP